MILKTMVIMKKEICSLGKYEIKVSEQIFRNTMTLPMIEISNSFIRFISQQKKSSKNNARLFFSIDVAGRIVNTNVIDTKSYNKRNNNNDCILGGANGKESKKSDKKSS